jgi:hypothetical protein
VRVGRSENGRLRLTDHVRWYSPGFDANDVGYLRQADQVANQAIVGWVESAPKGPFREHSFELSREDHWDFGGLKTRGSTTLEASGQFRNKWRLSGEVQLTDSVDTRALRGGPALRASSFAMVGLGVSSDSSRRTSLSFMGMGLQARDGGTRVWEAAPSLRVRPSNRLLLTANVAYTRVADDLQYVTTVQAADGPRWLLGRIDQRTWSFTVRANLAVTPELTLQYYGSPFVSVGRYTDFKAATNTLAAAYEDRFHRFTASELSFRTDANAYQVNERPGAPGYAFDNPDFSFRQFRSNLVARWEYKPGSAVFVVWSQGRTGSIANANDAFRTNWNEMWRARPDNVFLLKASYWFSL